MIERHKFYSGLVRHNIILGVPQIVLGALFLFGGICFIGSSNFLGLLVPVPLWLGAYLMCLKDPDYLSIIFTRIFILPARVPNSKFWGGRSYLP